MLSGRDTVAAGAAAAAVAGVVAVGVVAVVVAVVAVVAVGGDDVVALAGRPVTASGDSGGFERGALGGGTRIDGDVPAAGGAELAIAVGGGIDGTPGFTPSTPSPTAPSDGTFGAAGTAPRAGDFTASSPGKRTAGIARLDALRARTGGALAMNTSRFSIARNGVQC